MGAPGEDDFAGLTLARIFDALPEGFDALRAEADAEGHGNLARLAEEFAADREGFTALLAAFSDGQLVGIGGLTPEPEASPGSAYRMRRLFVSARARRRGVGTALANALLNEALGMTRLVTVHAGTPEAAAFWQALGFEPVAGRAWSHEYFA